MRVKIFSDAHTEFFGSAPVKFERILDKYLPQASEDYQTVLVCAGDMGTYAHYNTTYKTLFAILSKRFKAVVIVPGNHSWYNTAGIWSNEKEFWKDKKLPKNVHYLDNEVKVIEGVAFIGSCLWTSFYNSDPVAMMSAKKAMNDFKCIKKRNYEVHGVYGTVIDSSRLQPEDTVERFNESCRFIKTALDKHKDKPCVVVTHHAPSEQSVGERYKGDILNAAYFTELTELTLSYSPKVWVHGHMHDSKDYMMGETRVICNPLGYHAVEVNKKFDPDLVVEV